MERDLVVDDVGRGELDEDLGDDDNFVWLELRTTVDRGG